MSAPRADRPRILVSGRIGPNGGPTVGAAYLEALRRAGAEPVVVAPHTPATGTGGDRGGVAPAAARATATADGLLLTGGPDVDPRRYGAEPHPSTYGVDVDRDAWEAALLQAAMAAGRPVLAICRGMQLVNVELGGTLLQHLPDHPGLLAHAPDVFPRPAGGDAGPRPAVTVPPGSRLHALLQAGGGEVVVRGHHRHHQAVGRVAADLRVTARCADGVVEAVEHPLRWVVAVQWHPEDAAAGDPITERLFAGLVGEADRRRRHAGGGAIRGEEPADHPSAVIPPALQR